MKLSSIPDQYIGVPWSDATNCWWLVRAVQQSHFGIFIPEFPLDGLDVKSLASAIEANPETERNWKRVIDPQHGDVAFMSRKTLPHHVGTVWNGGILHVLEGGYVCVASKRSMKWNGWKVTDYYRYNG